MSESYLPVIGLEVHIELSTKSKMFCGCSANHFLVEANSQVCPVCLGLPGALPYANREAIEATVKFGLALDCKINTLSKFDRKHYFYPDLSKGYQISQYGLPLCESGKFQIQNYKSEIRIRRVHLEEDTGKLVHTILDDNPVSLVDFNRCGVPLMEMVTEPDFSDPLEVDVFLKEIQLIVRYLGISDADMEKGSMRLEVNISVREGGTSGLPPYKVELKNINSFRFVKKAIDYEFERQVDIIKSGKRPVQETRGFNEKTGRTYSQRTKEEAQDYRYFPEPDIPPIEIIKSQISKLKSQTPELPRVKRERFAREYELLREYIEILVQNKDRAEYFEEALRQAQDKSVDSSKLIASSMVNQNLDQKFPEPAGLISYLTRLSKREYATFAEVETAARQILSENPKAVADYKSGNANVLGFLIGQTQKILKGKGDVKMIRQELLKKLQK